jgi:hypothetical protein
MARYNTINDFDEFINKIGYLKQYLRVYDEKEILLFNSRSKGDIKILSNFWASSVPLPWRGLEFTSVEAMIIWSFIDDNCKIPNLQSKKKDILQTILDSKDGKEVKNNKEATELYHQLRDLKISEIGEENWDLYDWNICNKAIKVKYDYCPEFRKVVDDNKDKYFCENSYWKDIPKAGVLKVTDQNSKYLGKYIRANYTGIAIQKCVTI